MPITSVVLIDCVCLEIKAVYLYFLFSDLDTAFASVSAHCVVDVSCEFSGLGLNPDTSRDRIISLVCSLKDPFPLWLDLFYSTSLAHYLCFCSVASIFQVFVQRLFSGESLVTLLTFP